MPATSLVETEANVSHSEASSESQSFSETEIFAKGCSESEGGQSVSQKSSAKGSALSTGTTSGRSGSSVTSDVPFYEYKKSRVVSSRTFVTLPEFITRWLVRVKTLPKAHFAIKVPGRAALIVKAPFVKTPTPTKRRSTKGLRILFAQPFYQASSPLPSAGPVLEFQGSSPTSGPIIDVGVIESPKQTSISAAPERSLRPRQTAWDRIEDTKEHEK